MDVLLCNDDGVEAPGLHALHEALTDPTGRLGGPLATRCLVAPPLTVQSATGHGITFSTPIMTRRVRVREGLEAIAIDGRPADCVKIALAHLWPEKFGAGTRPDLVISGMNHGANVGINVLYSGTVAAALEAAFLGVPAVAVSLHLGRGTPRFDVAAAHARRTIERLLSAWPGRGRGGGGRGGGGGGGGGGPLFPHACLSINVPVTEGETAMPPVRLCAMNVHGAVDRYQRGVSPAGEAYFWSAGTPLAFHGSDEGKDVAELMAGAITVTPLRYDLTDEAVLARWRGLMS